MKYLIGTQMEIKNYWKTKIETGMWNKKKKLNN